MRLTLEELEAERGEIEPFELDLGDVVVNLPHPEDLPFETLVSFEGEDPAGILRTMMGGDVFDRLAGDKRVTLGIMKSVLTKYYAHYGLGGPGEDQGSPPSAIGSASTSKRTSRRKATA